ncbi:MAG: hypothetical protein FD165_2516 [Gammaproteobacteria bacterium]|nr:MAG: hypothetical protein FD165_2516 [Gammaproteobacteria bacterium]TND02897.1 MAG: hypothetical protein FD120_1966 [Gammaproteobacteria bacterium]
MQITPTRDNPNAPSSRAVEQESHEVARINELAPYPRIEAPVAARSWRGRDRRRPAAPGRTAHRREGVERRRDERRRMNVPVMLDTRSRRERRTHIRRQEEAAHPKRYPRLRGVNIIV